MATKKESNVTELKKPVKKPAAKKTKTKWPQVTKGTHLTVIAHENGRTELFWDDKALQKEVHDAIIQFEMSQKKPAVRAKATPRLKRIK